MTRYARTINLATGKETLVPFTPAEEAAADAAAEAERRAPPPQLNRIQFEFMVEKLGLGAAIESAIGDMKSSTDEERDAKLMAKVLFRSGQRFERSHPLFDALAPAIGKTPEEIDAIWIQASAI